jgi:NADH dehydrogenase (ubiquinone) 1 alpha subcomplex subunit 9
MDVAQALANLVSLPPLARDINLPGPSTLSHEYLLDLVSSLTYNPPSSAPVLPKAITKLATDILSKAVWWDAMSPDEIERRYIDDADLPGDWDAVGVNPAEIEQHAITYVRRYRSGPNYGRPIVLPGRPSPALEVS